MLRCPLAMSILRRAWLLRYPSFSHVADPESPHQLRYLRPHEQRRSPPPPPPHHHHHPNTFKRSPSNSPFWCVSKVKLQEMRTIKPLSDDSSQRQNIKGRAREDTHPEGQLLPGSQITVVMVFSHEILFWWSYSWGSCLSLTNLQQNWCKHMQKMHDYSEMSPALNG